MKSVPLVNANGSGRQASTQGAAFWTSFSRGEFASPYGLAIEGYDFAAFTGINRGMRQAFESAARALCVVLRGPRIPMPGYRELDAHLLEMLRDAGWKIGGEEEFQRWRGARVTREAVKPGNEVGRALQRYGVSPGEVERLLEWHAAELSKKDGRYIERREKEYCSTFLTHDDGDGSVVFMKWNYAVESHFFLDLAFGDAFAPAAQALMRSEFVWRCSPLSYCSSSQDRHGTVVRIDRPIRGRDGEGMFFDGFEPSSDISRSSRQHGLPLFPVQFAFEHFWRLL